VAILLIKSPASSNYLTAYMSMSENRLRIVYGGYEAGAGVFEINLKKSYVT
jgi:hypothetical protein